MTELQDFVSLNQDIQIIRNKFKEGFSSRKKDLELQIFGPNIKTSPYLLGELGFSIYNLALYQYKRKNYERGKLIDANDSIKDNDEIKDRTRLIKRIRDNLATQEKEEKLTASEYILSYIQKNAQSSDFYVNINTNPEESGIIITPNKNNSYVAILIRYMLKATQEPNLLINIQNEINPHIKNYVNIQKEKNRHNFEREQRIANRAKGIST